MEDDDTEVTFERNPKTAKSHAKSTYEMQRGGDTEVTPQSEDRRTAKSYAKDKYEIQRVLCHAVHDTCQ